MKCVDHLGNEFKYKSEMYKYWGVNEDVAKKREKAGWGLEDILTTPTRSQRKLNEPVFDHLGNEFKTEKDMYKYWGIERSIANYRKKIGWTLEDVLTKPVSKASRTKKCVDHLGNEFDSERAMYRHWNIPEKVGQARKKSGWSVKDILTTPLEKTYTDHLGNEFKTEKEMYQYWNIPEKVGQSRKKLGWSTEGVLTTPIHKTFTDHKGNIFESEREMYTYWGIPEKIGQFRKRKGWSIEKLLTTPPNDHIRKFKDPVTGNRCTLSKLSEIYGVKLSIIEHRLQRGYSLIQALDISFRIPKNVIYFSQYRFTQSKYNIIVDKRIKKGKDVFECYIDNGDDTSTFKIMSYDMIDQYCLDQYKKLHNAK